MKTLFSTPDERHAFLIGLCEGFPFWRPLFPFPSLELQAALSGEYHYYVFGRFLSTLLLVVMCYLLVSAFR